MADEVLSQAELETLFSAVESSVAPPGAAKPPAQRSRRPSLEPRVQQHDAIVPFDFKRPRPASDEQMQAVRALHEGLARDLAAALAALLRSTVETKLASVVQLTYGEFVGGLENPTCFNLVQAAPLGTQLFLEISPSILFPIIDRLLGGGRETTPVARRPLTQIELRLASRVTALFLAELRTAWHAVIDVQLSVERVESDPQTVQTVPPAEAVVVLCFELTLNASRGAINLCIPRGGLERLLDKPASGNWRAHGSPQTSRETVKQLGENLRQSAVELIVHLAETKVISRDMFGLAVGDIITTEKDVHSPVAISVAGVTKYRARPGAFQGRKAVEIEERVDPPPASQSQD